MAANESLCNCSCVVFLLLAARALAAPLAGDVNADTAVNALDVQLVINAALGTEFTYDCDIDYSNGVGALDVQLVINAALGISIDTDGDGLCDVGEANLGSNPNKGDSDDDGLGDWKEVHVYNTDPSATDSDGDGTHDVDEPLVQLAFAMEDFLDDQMDAGVAADQLDLALAAAEYTDGGDEAVKSLDRALSASINSIEDAYALWDRSNAVGVRYIEPDGALRKEDIRTTLIFINGVFNSYPDFMVSLHALKKSVGDIEGLAITGVYNPTGSSSEQYEIFQDLVCPGISVMLTSSCEGGLVRSLGRMLEFCSMNVDDLVNSAYQFFSDPTDTAFYRDEVYELLKDTMYEELDKGRTVIFIPHSQGNFYVRDVVKDVPYTHAYSIATIQVASPSPSMPVRNVRVNVCGDKVPLLSGLPSWPCIPFEGRCPDSDEHSFVDSYLSGQSLATIRQYIGEFMGELYTISDITVDENIVVLRMDYPSETITVSNAGEDELSWTATVEPPTVSVCPDRYTGDSVEVTITATDFIDDYKVNVTFTNNANPVNRELVQVFVTGTHITVTPPETVAVDAGTFLMGDPREEKSGEALPRHSVTLSAYEIGKYEVTNQQYADVLKWAYAKGRLGNYTLNASGIWSGWQSLIEFRGNSPYSQLAFADDQFVPLTRDGYSMANHPVVLVSWFGAVAYCNWLSESQGLEPCYDLTGFNPPDLSKNGYRLPTEAEWERAAAWNGVYHYLYGNGSDEVNCENANYFPWLDGAPGELCNPLGLTDRPYTVPVGYYNGTNGTKNSPSPVGCYDMMGNVWEWCHDLAYREYTAEPVTDPTGPETGTGHVYRDGYAASRRAYNFVGRTENLGFRIAR